MIRILLLKYVVLNWILFLTDKGNLKMSKVRITQVRSAIRRPKRQKLTLKALGIKKLHQSRDMETSPQVLGMIDKVKHLLKVEEIKA